MAKKIVLASSSPRRRELLENIGLTFTVDPSEIREAQPAGLKPAELARTLSLHKARAAAAHHTHSIIIAADTIGVLDGKILGKPLDSPHARKMLAEMSGRCHSVITGFTVVDSDTGRTISSSVETKVFFRKLSRGEISRYVNTGEPMNKAGAYAIQGLGALLVERIEGDYNNVIGLPLCSLAVVLKGFGVTLPV
ncbi:MAG: Maf family protein [Dehalococcoidia bacterium]|nr:Maf family protein [Dehalococcoidia bacterium]